jgi:fumarylacetoacetase
VTWLQLSNDEPYGLSTLPYGIFRVGADQARVGVRVADQVLDVYAVARALGHDSTRVFDATALNPLMELGPASWSRIRAWITSLFAEDAHRELVTQHLLPLDSVTLQLPIDVADYVDFYASERHARNVGAIFRPDNPDLPPNWKHLPIGYHGRAGTVVVSGTPIVRPHGQCRSGPDPNPVFGPSNRLDIECEVGFVVGQPTDLGSPVAITEAEQHIFGVVLLNDWSARDIQAWEYVPLGPFLGKSFATSISAWVVPWEAFTSARIEQPPQEPQVLGYLDTAAIRRPGLDLHLEVAINGRVVTEPEFSAMYWTPAQMLAHLTVNGASLRVGDLFGSGTVSGDDRTSFGSLLELTWNGTQPIELGDGSTRGYLDDGDVVVMTGWAPAPDGGRVTLGEVSGTITESRTA